MATQHLEDLAGSIRPRTASNLLLWVIAAFFILALLWATFTQLDRTVHGMGRVVPTAQLQVVSNLEGGVIKQILVKPGQDVKAGQPLILLDPTATGSELGTSQTAVDTLSVKANRLEAEVRGTDPQFPVTSDPAINEQITIERSLHASRQADLASLTAAATARAIQADRAVSEASANVDAARAARDAAQQQADMLRPLVANGIEPKLSLIQAERQASVAISQLASSQAALARARAGVAEARATLNQQRQDWRAKSAEELATTQAEMAARRRGLPALSSRVDRTTLRAPLAGRVNRVLATTVGGSVRAGEPLVEIVPAASGLTIEVAVKPSDIAFIRMGQRALVKLTAYDYSIYGGLEGKVVGISPDAIVNEKTEDSHYLVRVRTSEPGLHAANGQLLPVTPGMIADVNLLGDKRSIMSYLLTPITRLQENAFRDR